MITYGPNGISRGIATIIFSKPGAANNAFLEYNGILVDDRPMKVQLQLQSVITSQ
jgi:THO complex subunit 4